MSMTIVDLQCEGNDKGFGKQTIQIVLYEERSDEYRGQHTSLYAKMSHKGLFKNGVTFPKFAWKEVKREVIN